MSLTKDILKSQSPWGSGGPSRGDNNGSGSRREPPSLDELIGNLQVAKNAHGKNKRQLQIN